MGLFRPYQRTDAADTSDTSVADEQEIKQTGRKTAPTPTRREAELARRERVRPTLTKKERKVRERELKREREDRAYEQAEKRPERVLLRNFIDARWTFGEFVWPILLLSFAIFIAGSFFPQLVTWATYAMWAVIVLILLEATFLWQKFRRLLDQRLPGAYRKGLVMYMVSRTITPRRFRRPGTAIDRGAEY
ncbi:DUF3043 domain-containing protein [Propionimicrobium sp. PCR01-08-3]|uniref:DUF3043 domain-containing protein n=1 Tax=Propionimicrobium sp. PCR01-08-3 TaxID=3052086 RepID=UPI00255CDC0B|nr:DUF3043 domain-containing protein [Propionimicrobium sp. PCR01-08-3]WIY81690.1 DUF3043 domain-containing protein [Propionimicrobium sp. PCR01-08-3]